MFGRPEPGPPALPQPLASAPQFGANQPRPTGSDRLPRMGGTLLTSSQGDLTPAATTRKSLLGQ